MQDFAKQASNKLTVGHIYSILRFCAFVNKECVLLVCTSAKSCVNKKQEICWTDKLAWCGVQCGRAVLPGPARQSLT